jgi:hypothetical protein
MPPSPLNSKKFISVDKVDDNTISIVKEVPAVEEIVTHNYQDLLNRRDAIQADLDWFTAERQKELDDVNALIAECENLGMDKKVEPSPIEPIEPTPP